jgi:threonine/homoserine/homoserine lactone efflux protein
MSAFGISALIISFPLALDIIRISGAGYLFYLAWQSIHPDAKSIFEFKKLEADSPLRLYWMGFFTNILNPKAMILFMSIMPHFISHKIGHIYTQFAILALIQLIASIIMNGIFIISAGTIATFLSNNPKWVKIQKYIMGAVLILVGLSILLEK